MLRTCRSLNKRGFKVQTLALGLLLCWAFLVWVTWVNLPEVSRTRQEIINSHIDVQWEKLEELTQKSLDYFAKTVEVHYRVVENNYRQKKLFLSEVNLVNTGRRAFPGRQWAIVFCQTYELEPDHAPYPNGVLKAESGVRLFNHMGGVYSVEPTESFGDIVAGGNKTFQMVSKYASIAVTDTYPNWYFAVPGLEARVIENTRGEGYDWVANYSTPSMWKRITNPAADDYDTYDPFTAEVRFHKTRVEDLAKAPIPVIPSPAEISEYDPTLTLNIFSGPWVILTETKLSREASYLSDIWNLPLRLEGPPDRFIQFLDAPIVVNVGGKRVRTTEAYELRVSPEAQTIIIRASQPAGAFYAIQSLLSLTDTTGHIPKTQIRDAPRFEYRGVMIDVARNFQSKEKVFRYIDLMAMYKLNKLHIHLTDDEGWRLAIPGLPELTQIGATRCHDLSETKCLMPFLGTGPFSGPPGTGHYTVDDYRDILRYAGQHHIEVIPEIDVPGHSHAAIRAMEARHRRLLSLNVTEATRFLLQDLQDKSQYASIQGFTHNAINPCLQSTYTFIGRVINSLFAMHRDVNPLKTFHFGGDEVAKGAWKKSPVCQRLLRNGVKTSVADYLAIQIANMTSLYGLDLAGWEDGMMDDDKPMRRDLLRNRNVYAYTWNNVWEWGNARRAYDFANNDYKLVMTSATNLYFDHPYEPDPRERGLYWATRYTDTNQVFTFQPENIYWSALSTREGKNVTICQENDDCPPLTKPNNLVGIQGTMFGELLRSQDITDFMLLPRLLGLAERAWHKAPWESEAHKGRREAAMAKDWTQFANTLGYKELARLDKLGYKYRVPPPGATIKEGQLVTSGTFPGLRVEMSVDQGNTWTIVPAKGASVDDKTDIWLRTRSALGNRYSRLITIPRSQSNVATCPVFSLAVLLISTLARNYFLQD